MTERIDKTRIRKGFVVDEIITPYDPITKRITIRIDRYPYSETEFKNNDIVDLAQADMTWGKAKIISQIAAGDDQIDYELEIQD